MDPQTNSATQSLIAEMEQDIQRFKQISVEHHQTPMSLANSTARKRLYDLFEAEKARFYISYSQDKSFRLEALHKALFMTFNQYLIEHVGSIDELHQAPAFIDYLFNLSEEFWQTINRVSQAT
jgi:hypothetical protein